MSSANGFMIILFLLERIGCVHVGSKRLEKMQNESENISYLIPCVARRKLSFSSKYIV